MRDMTASKKYPFYVKVSWNTSGGFRFLNDINRFFPRNDAGLLSVLDAGGADDHLYEHDSAFLNVPLSGPANYGGVEVVVENREKQGFVYFWFRSAEGFAEMLGKLRALRAEHKASSRVQRTLMRMSINGNWYDAGQYPCRTPEMFVGYGAYLERIVGDVRRLAKHRQLIEKMGESVCLNYLLYGPPGTGKTTLALTVANMLDMTVFIASSTTRKHALLTPPGGGLRVLLFEDFDRCLTTADGGEDGAYMSDLLNTLDGVNSGSGIVRFFTGNDCLKIFANKALISRMTATFRFDSPTRDMFQAKLDNVYAAVGLRPPGRLTFDPPADMSLRQFSAFAIRHALSAGDRGGDGDDAQPADPTLADVIACQHVSE